MSSALARPVAVAPPPLDQLADDDLVARAVEGDHAAFAQLVDRYKAPVFLLAQRILGRASDAEDAAQETFLRAYTRLQTYRPNSRFRSWLLAITAHWCFDHLRGERTFPLGFEDAELLDDDRDEMPEARVLRDEQRGEVRSLLSRLPPHYRRVLVMRHWHDLSYSEMSEVLDVPVSTVRMRLHRARQALGKLCYRGRGGARPLPVNGGASAALSLGRSG